MTVVYKHRYNSFFKVEDGVKTRISEQEWLSGMGLLGDDDASRQGDLWEETRETGEEETRQEEANEKVIVDSEIRAKLKAATIKKLETGNYDYEDLTHEEWNSLDLPVAD